MTVTAFWSPAAGDPYHRMGQKAYRSAVEVGASTWVARAQAHGNVKRLGPADGLRSLLNRISQKRAETGT